MREIRKMRVKNGNLVTRLKSVWVSRDSFDNRLDLWSKEPKLMSGSGVFQENTETRFMGGQYAYPEVFEWFEKNTKPKPAFPAGGKTWEIHLI